MNERLAKHYGIPTAAERYTAGAASRAFEQFGRGGILAQATTLAKQSGARAPVPILRGNWVSEVLLGEKLAPAAQRRAAACPRTKRRPSGLTVRQLVEKHTQRRQAARCAIARSIRSASRSRASTRSAAAARRTWADRPIDTQDKTPDGTPSSKAWTACGTICWRRAATPSAAVLPQAAGLCAGPRRAAFRRAAAGRDAGWLAEERLPILAARRNDRAEPPVPRDSRPRHGRRMTAP